MGLAHAQFCNFGDIQIAQFSDSIREEDVCTFDIPVDNFVLVQHFQPGEYLISHFPDKIFFETFLGGVFEISYFALQVPSICILHHNT